MKGKPCARPGKRERELLRLAAATLSNETRQRPTFAPADPKALRSPRGSINSVDAMRGATHTNFRGQGAGFNTREIWHGPASVGRVDMRKGWQRQPSLPDVSFADAKRGDTFNPVESESLPPSAQNVRPTAPTEKRFGKTK